MATNAERDRSRLPKWAAAYMQQLEREVEFWKEKATAGPADTDTRVILGLNDSIPLDKGAQVRFQLQDVPWYGGHIDVRVTSHKTLQVMSPDGVRIRPIASNAFEVESVER